VTQICTFVRASAPAQWPAEIGVVTFVKVLVFSPAAVTAYGSIGWTRIGIPVRVN
jgi:hypothetical protein